MLRCGVKLRRVLGQPVSDLRRRRSPQGPRHRRLPVRRLLVVVLGAAIFLLPAGASGGRDIPHASVTPRIFGTLGANGWYVSNVTINWVIEPVPYAGSAGCDARTITTDTVLTSLTCHAWWGDGNDITVTVPISRDATAPAVSAVPDRAADANGWYNHALSVGFAGSDATSGIESCTHATYAGPDNPNVALTGSCRDWAGHQTAASATFKYDATPPVIRRLAIRAGKRSAKVKWRTTGAQTAQLLRSPGLKGATESVLYTGQKTEHVDGGLKPGRKYHYRLVATDEAANQATKAIDFVARGALLYPAPGERASKPPLLIWTAKRGASYYNVILVRGRRVFSAWPLRARLQLPRKWTYRGQRYKLRPGLYRWYVWPGRGPLSAGNYGRLLGGSTFIVSR